MIRAQASEKTWNVVGACALVALAALAFVDYAVPKPRITTSVATRNRDIAALSTTVDNEQRDLKTTQASTQKFLWAQSEDEIQSQSLAMATDLAKRNSLTLLGFRSQRATVQGNVEQLPYMILVEGPYPGVVAFLSQLEGIQNKLAVTMVQVASSDESSDQVNATIGVNAYTTPKQKEEAKSGKGK